MSILSKFNLADRMAIVTGSGQGIGKGIAMALAEAGADLVVADMNAETVEVTASEISERGNRVLATVTDVRHSEQVADMVKKTMDEFGRIDILVNNAGGSFRAPFLEFSEKGWDAIVRATLKSVFLVTSAVAKIMADQKKGNIISIASVSGLRGEPGSAPYGAAKAGVINLTKTLAVELSPYSIRINCIAPGGVDTPGTAPWRTEEVLERTRRDVPLGRVGTIEEIASAALYLASDASSYMTGETILIDGGSILKGSSSVEKTEVLSASR
jgi:NAD(P)-dependent dehydrogenase (short-subunit alcohol dehydrogenase family)